VECWSLVTQHVGPPPDRRPEQGGGNGVVQAMQYLSRAWLTLSAMKPIAEGLKAVRRVFLRRCRTLTGLDHLDGTFRTWDMAPHPRLP